MINRLIILLIITELLLSCKNKTAENTIALKSEDNKSTVDNCNCFTGIGSTNGDKPAIQFKLSNGQCLSVCGFVDKEMEGTILSEFNVFECSSGKSLVEYDATQICRIVTGNDTLKIEELIYLPIGKNWSWELIQFGERILTTKGNQIYISKNLQKLEKYSIDDTEANRFLNSLKKGRGLSSEWELEIGKLEALSLVGNKKAWDILKDYEKFTGQETDGAVAETWKDAVSTVEWIKKITACNMR